MAGSRSGCWGVLKVIVATLRVTGAASRGCVPGLPWTLGLMAGLGEIPMLLQMTATPAGVVTFLEGSSRPSPSCPFPSNGGNPRPSLLAQAVAALLRRPLLGGIVRIARGVPCRRSRLLPGAWTSRAQCTPLSPSPCRCSLQIWLSPAVHLPIFF